MDHSEESDRERLPPEVFALFVLSGYFTDEEVLLMLICKELDMLETPPTIGSTSALIYHVTPAMNASISFALNRKTLCPWSVCLVTMGHTCQKVELYAQGWRVFAFCYAVLHIPIIWVILCQCLDEVSKI